MIKKDLAQFKFSSGQEIVCEVIDWPDEGEEEIIVKNAMSISMGETLEGERIYMFRPWAQYLEKENEYIIINPMHVVSSNRPNFHLIREYEYAVSQMHDLAKERDEEYLMEKKRQNKGYDIALDKVLIEEGIEEKYDFDSSGKNNIIQFPGTDTIH